MLQAMKNASNLPVVKSDGTPVVPGPNGVVLASSSTYFLLLGGEYAPIGEHPLASIHVKWGTVFVGSFVPETCNFARKLGAPDTTGPDDITDFSVTKGDWIREDPSTAYVSTTSSDGTTGAATVVNATVTVAGGTAGGTMYHIGNLGTRRVRLRINVTTGDTLRFGAMMKQRGASSP